MIDYSLHIIQARKALKDFENACNEKRWTDALWESMKVKASANALEHIAKEKDNELFKEGNLQESSAVEGGSISAVPNVRNRGKKSGKPQ